MNKRVALHLRGWGLPLRTALMQRQDGRQGKGVVRVGCFGVAVRSLVDTLSMGKAQGGSPHAVPLARRVTQ